MALATHTGMMRGILTPLIALVMIAPVAAALPEVELDPREPVSSALDVACQLLPGRGIPVGTLDDVAGSELGDDVSAVGDDLENVRAWCESNAEQGTLHVELRA